MFEAGDDLPGLQIMKRQHIQCETWMQTVELARADKSWPGWSYVNHSVKDAPTYMIICIYIYYIYIYVPLFIHIDVYSDVYIILFT